MKAIEIFCTNSPYHNVFGSVEGRDSVAKSFRVVRSVVIVGRVGSEEDDDGAQTGVAKVDAEATQRWRGRH